ncbi:MAG: hypothetical protein VKL60_08625 [Sphaerospermopsis sp.]|nr:hypothetical protein [Sphaerospermopsis sp.]
MRVSTKAITNSTIAVGARVKAISPFKFNLRLSVRFFPCNGFKLERFWLMRLQLQLVISTLRIKSDCAERSAGGDRIFPRMIDNLEVAGDQGVRSQE